MKLSARLPILLTSAALTVSMAVQGAPASAHSGLKPGKYHCYMGFEYSNFDLKIKDANSYVFLMGSDSVGKGGNFVHDGEKVRFKSGYLHNKGFRGKHVVDATAYVASFRAR